LRNVTYTLGGADFLYTKAREVREHSGMDVLFLGSSHAYRTFDPRIFDRYGINTFNLGSSNQSLLQTEVLLGMIDTLKPRLVVLEVHPDIVAIDGVEASIYQVCNVEPSWRMVPMVLRTKNMKVYCTAVYALLHNSFSSSFKHFTESESGGNRYAGRGFVERDVEHFAPTPVPADTIRMRGDQLSALRRCVSILRKREVPYILLEVPDTKVQTAAYINLGEFHTTMKQYGNFYYIPMDELDDSLHFYDVTHLNQDGVALYDEFIYDTLIKKALKGVR
jgi:hypothetical protein